MSNPTTGWDKVPIFGWWQTILGTPIMGKIRLTIDQRITRVDGTVIYPGPGSIDAQIGLSADQDAAARSTIRAAMRAEASALPGFNGTAWDAAWDARLASGVFFQFPAVDDPDIVQDDFYIKVEELLDNAQGRTYWIQPLLSQLDDDVPGINLGFIEVPPVAIEPNVGMFAKGIPGGVAALNETGQVVNAEGTVVGEVDPSDLVDAIVQYFIDNPIDTGGGGGTMDPEQVRDSIAASFVNGTNIVITANDVGDTITISSTATQNDTDANLRARSTHTGTQTSATISDFTEAAQDAIGAMLAAGTGIGLTYNDASNSLTITNVSSSDPEAIRDAIGTALIATGLLSIVVNDGSDTITFSTTATANQSDAYLLNLGNATGTLPQANVTGLTAALALLAPISTTLTLAGAQTITGVKTFTANPIFNDASIPQAKVIGLVSALAGVTGAGNVYTIDYNVGLSQWPLRNGPFGVLPAGAVVIWRGFLSNPAPATAGYAIAGVDEFELAEDGS